MSNIFEQASRLKLRFNTTAGSISTEQLWDMKEDSLITFEEQLTEVVEGYGKSTRRNKGRKTNQQTENELRLAIVTSILDTRIKEREEQAEIAETKAYNQKIMDLIAQKQETALGEKSIDELRAMLK